MKKREKHDALISSRINKPMACLFSALKRYWLVSIYCPREEKKIYNIKTKTPCEEDFVTLTDMSYGIIILPQLGIEIGEMFQERA